MLNCQFKFVKLFRSWKDKTKNSESQSQRKLCKKVLLFSLIASIHLTTITSWCFGTGVAVLDKTEKKFFCVYE